MGNETFYHALKINSEVCTGCTHCMNVCPTAAIRIKYGKATINEAACTDCGMCLKTCPRQAIYVEQDDFNQIFKFSYRFGKKLLQQGQIFLSNDERRQTLVCRLRLSIKW